MAKMTDNELLSVLGGMVGDATTNQDRFITENEELYQRYKGELYGNETPGRSSAVSNDAKDLVESDMPSLVRSILGSNEIMRFKPMNPNNESQVKEADEKTAYVDWLIRGQEDSYRIQSGFLKDILIQKMGVQKYFFHSTDEVEEHFFKGIDEEELEEVFESLESGSGLREVEVVSQEENEDLTFDIKFKVRVKRQSIKIMGVPTERFLISQNTECLEEADLVGDFEYKTRGELLAEGYSRDVVENIPTSTIFGTNRSYMHQIRFRDEGVTESFAYRQWANETVKVFDLYVMVDYDGDGIAERRHIQKAGDEILLNEVFNHVPYAMASALLIPHKAIGQGRVEQVTPTQKVNTALLRQMLDNGYMVNNPKLGVNSLVNLDDALSSTIGGVVRSKGEGNPGNNVFPVTIPSIAQESLLLLQHMEQRKAATVGNQLASQGLNADQLGKETATRFKGVEEASQSKIELVLRNIVEVGYRKLYNGVAWMVEHYQDAETEFNVLGKALKSNPAKWKFEHQLISEIGLGAGDDEKIADTMTAIYSVQQQLKAQGSPLVDEVKIYNSLNKVAKASGLKDTSMYFNNPEEPDELLLAQNEMLNQMVLTLQQQLQAAQNPLAESEQIKAQATLVKAQSDNQIKLLELEQKQQQFLMDMQQKQEQFFAKLAQEGRFHNDDTAVELTKIEANTGKDVQGSQI